MYLTNTRFLFIIFLAVLLSPLGVRAQLPRAGLVYIDYDSTPTGTSLIPHDSIYIYDPGLPISATNPILDTIIFPHNNVGLAISPVLGSSDTTLTFYTGVADTFYYYDPATHLWVNTGIVFGASQPNFAAGGGYLYSIDGFLGYITRYDGITAPVSIGLTPGAIPFDLLADCSGNIYVLRASEPYMNMIEYTPDHLFIQGWSVVNPYMWTPSGGIANIGNDIYTDISFIPQLAHFIVSATDVTLDTTTPDIPFLIGNTVGDMASVAGGPLTDILPTIVISSSDTTVCQGASVSFTGTVTNADSTAHYQWYVNDTPFAGATNNVFTYQPHNGDVVSAHLTTHGACSDLISYSPSITLHVTVSAAALSYGADTFCTSPATIVPASFTPVGGSFSAMGALPINAATGAIDLGAAAPGIYEVTYTAGSGGCIALAKDTLLLEATPIVKLNVSDTNVCFGDTVKLAWSGDSAYQYTWQPGYYTLVAVADNNAGAAILHSGYIGLLASDAACYSGDSIYINAHSCCQVSVPSAFSPNDDGLNDLFCAVNNGRYKLESFIVQNRWGQTVFRSSDSKPCWDGKFNGVPAETGAYFYLIRYSCYGADKDTQEKGDVTLIR